MTWYGAALSGFFLLVLLTVLTYTLITGISPMPSSTKAREEVFRQLAKVTDQSRPMTIIDLGSGWGHLVVPLAKRYTQHRVIGYELSFFPWLTSYLVKQLFRLNNLTLHRKDFLKADLSHADVLVCYLFPKAMTKLNNKLKSELESPLTVVSIFFALPDHKADVMVPLHDLYNTPVYVYRL